MVISFAERSDQLCDQLRTIEHQSEDSDTLFYCAYLLGLLGVHGGIDAEGKEEFDTSFNQELNDVLEREAVSEQDKQQILSLLESVR
ncbi:hypothetical protein O1D97_04840 [Marinomonas sp. 15G1-11]|uniref:YfcL protein n=1 Tax=Marinomonas phaeophyticola TaxID=3004091 RepID=A0ABT4JRT7_9GAMM|nr:hypothetical protein [Marinomonas sp. 15G1-11]MCZ2720991.1 hypothetical protein [Marinomonas sp. 15G1-11]